MKTSLLFLLAITIVGNLSFSSGLGFTTRTIAAKKSRREQLPTSSNLLQDIIIDKDCCHLSLRCMATRGGAAEKKSRRGVDFVAILKYGIGFGVQMSLIYGLLVGVDKVVEKLALKIPLYAKCIFFYFFNITTGTLSPLKGRREPSNDAEKKVKKMPKWTPPGYVFGIMWPLFVFGTRAATASMIVSASGGVFATSTLMSLMFHLGFGNLWNTVNNVERRLGFSVPVLYGLLFSNLYASYRFYTIDPLAGKLLAATSTWLAAAAGLETHTWIINPDDDTGKPEPLYPAKDPKWKTQFRWETS